MIKEVKTVTENHHTYQLPFKEFWEIVSKSKVISKSLFYSKMFSNDHQFTVYLESDAIDNYIKALSLKGKLDSLFLTKDDIVEITTTECEEQCL